MSAQVMPQLFAASPTITGYEVICTDTGHSVGFEREERNQANGIAQQLNQAAKAGPKALAIALRAN